MDNGEVLCSLCRQSPGKAHASRSFPVPSVGVAFSRSTSIPWEWGGWKGGSWGSWCFWGAARARHGNSSGFCVPPGQIQGPQNSEEPREPQPQNQERQSTDTPKPGEPEPGHPKTCRARARTPQNPENQSPDTPKPREPEPGLPKTCRARARTPQNPENQSPDTPKPREPEPGHPKTRRTRARTPQNLQSQSPETPKPREPEPGHPKTCRARAWTPQNLQSQSLDTPKSGEPEPRIPESCTRTPETRSPEIQRPQNPGSPQPHQPIPGGRSPASGREGPSAQSKQWVTMEPCPGQPQEALLTVNEQVIVMSSHETIRVLEVGVDGDPKTAAEGAGGSPAPRGPPAVEDAPSSTPSSSGGEAADKAKAASPTPVPSSHAPSQPGVTHLAVQATPQVLAQESLATGVTGVMVPAGTVTQPLLIPISIAGQVTGQQALALVTIPTATLAALPGLTPAAPAGAIFKPPVANLTGNRSRRRAQPRHPGHPGGPGAAAAPAAPGAAPAAAPAPPGAHPPKGPPDVRAAPDHRTGL
ncbi:POU domain, class 6, transcription factor 1 isoform X4 [Chamaea fasciata]|uniref:POU domain, class 6, transcription factor 1 isoform X4 n=1 Tax=Chamaea fasciata TaxID=190680 RepID=UPI00336A6EEB